MFRHFKFSILIGLGILILSLISLRDLPKVEVKAADKIGHFIAYFVLTTSILIENARRIRWSNQLNRWSIILLVSCTGYGVLMEFLQWASNTGRHFEFYDMIANFTGAAVATCIFYLMRNPLKKRLS